MALNVELLQSSFALVAPRADELADYFYDRLFSDFPAVVPLFDAVEMPEQKKKLLASLKLVVENLRRPDVLESALKDMGLRHVDYGAREEHYPAVGQTLLKSLAHVAGDAWNPELTDAWAEAYSVVADLMLAGAEEVVVA
ncbi:MAG: hypothetical protein KDA37_11020 [Planctomycetales bacterium]|nr:hypothetical protein [Planctomycetales bacterium]